MMDGLLFGLCNRDLILNRAVGSRSSPLYNVTQHQPSTWSRHVLAVCLTFQIKPNQTKKAVLNGHHCEVCINSCCS
jgi:hypothetical protein